MSLLPDGGIALEWFRRLILIVGLVPALGAAVYKGVLFNTTAQPVWSKARWLGGYLINSAVVLGVAELLILAIVMGQPKAVVVLRFALMPLLLLNLLWLGVLLTRLRGALSHAHSPYVLAIIGAVVVVAGLLVPLGLLALGAPRQMVAAVLFTLLGAIVVRSEIVRLPHLLGDAIGSGGRS
jgi:hypothetical protein